MLRLRLAPRPAIGRLENDQGSQAFKGGVDGNRLKWDMKVTGERT
jgi:hypothetical protein